MSTISAVSPLKYSERELLSFLLSDAAAKENPVAVWRLPGADTTQVIISEGYRELDPEQSLEDQQAGFLFAPFEKSRARLFLKADQLFAFGNGKLMQNNTPLEQRSHEWLQTQLPPLVLQKFKPSNTRGPLPPDGGKEFFLALVEAGLREIERGTFEKIVPSRTRTISLPASFDVIESFQKLSASYPEALISFVNIPGVGTWLGASPEVLVSVQDKRIFRTVALAGTLPYTPGTDLRSVAWTQKEIEEQALVERYVISCFKKIRLREYDEHGPRTVVAGNLMHLKSEFTVDIQATSFPQIGSVMLDLLHPTSAVCGMPLQSSLEFLRHHESYNRAFYSGYLGPVNIHNNIEIFVNLRCMQVCGSEAVLYAGAGVTIDSIPEKEWAETEMKFNTLLNVIL